LTFGEQKKNQIFAASEFGETPGEALGGGRAGGSTINQA